METKVSDSRDASALETHLGYWLHKVSNHVSGDFAQALQAEQTSVAEWVILRHLEAGSELTSSALAEALGMTRGAISKVLDKLEAKAWTARATSAQDSRVQFLSLTPAGRRVLPRLAAIADANDTRHFDCLAKSEKKELRRLLRKLVRHSGMNGVPST